MSHEPGNPEPTTQPAFQNRPSAFQTPPPAFQTQARDVAPVEVFARADDVFEAMLQSLQGGELHLRPALKTRDEDPAPNFLEIGVALKNCLHEANRREYLIQRLKPHRNVLITPLPNNILQYGLIPDTSAAPGHEPPFRPLEDIPDSELRQWLVVDGAMIYGELERHELENYFAFIHSLVRPGQTFYDLGSGLGKVVMSAALTFPFARCVGVELLGYRHRMAADRLGAMLAVRDRGLQSMPHAARPGDPLRLPTGVATTVDHLLGIESRVTLLEGNLFEVDLSDADVVFIYSTCFAPLMPALAHKMARELRDQTLVSTTSVQLSHPNFRLVRHFPAKTMAWTDVYFYRRVDSTEPAPAPVEGIVLERDEREWEARVRAELENLDRKSRGAG